MATTPNNLNLVDIGDPPVPNRFTAMMQLTGADVAQRIALPIGGGLLLGVWAWVCLRDGIWYWGIVIGIFAALFLLGGLSTTKTVAALCPFCEAKIFHISPGQNGQTVQCGKCYEYSEVNSGIVRPLDPKTFSEAPKFVSPVYRSNIWPRGCVTCGAPPTRFVTLSRVGASATSLLVTAGTQFTRRGEVTGIPYCDQHRDGVALRFRQSNKMLLLWCSLRMMRRYVAANRNSAA